VRGAKREREKTYSAAKIHFPCDLKLGPPSQPVLVSMISYVYTPSRRDEGIQVVKVEVERRIQKKKLKE
jgi:hypothetical protein